jgi:FtsH-binding integral membrane protein
MELNMATDATPADQSSTNAPVSRGLTLARPGTVVGAPARTVFGQVMGLVAVTIGFTALGAYLGRNLTGGTWILFFTVAFACIFGLQYATTRRRDELAVGLLFGLGLALGLAVAPVIHVYAKDDPAALRQAAAATAATVAALGGIGYATRRDLSSWVRFLFWALAALIVFGVVLIFVNIPRANIIYAVLGIVIFGGYTIFDFNRLRQADMNSAVPIAASIFLDVFNIFLFFLELFGGEER